MDRKSGTIWCVKTWQTALAIFVALSASFTLADDFKTIDGKEYKNVTVSEEEPDGITVKNAKAGGDRETLFQ